MADEIVLALVIKASRYNEYDKIVTLFSPRTGKFSGILKGVQKQKAKLKFAAEPFCLGEFELAGQGSVKTIIGCEQKESFFALTKDLVRFYCGSAVLEIINFTAQDGQENARLFVSVLKTLQCLCDVAADPKPVLIKFVLNVFDSMGQHLTFDRCAQCGKKDAERYFFDAEHGGVVCKNCARNSAYSPDGAVMSVLRVISSKDFGELSAAELNEGAVQNTLLFLNGLLSDSIHKIKSIRELLEL